MGKLRWRKFKFKQSSRYGMTTCALDNHIARLCFIRAGILLSSCSLMPPKFFSWSWRDETGGEVLGPLLLLNPLWRLANIGRISSRDLKTSAVKLFAALWVKTQSKEREDAQESHNKVVFFNENKLLGESETSKLAFAPCRDLRASNFRISNSYIELTDYVSKLFLIR